MTGIYNGLSEGQKGLVNRAFTAGVILSAIFLAGLGLYYAVTGLESLLDLSDRNAFVIAASGEGSVFLVPDVATLNLTVKTQAATVAAATRENTEKYNKVVAFLKSNGVASKDVKTSYYNVSPQYQYDSRPCLAGICPPPAPPKIVGYEVVNSLQVKVRKLDAVGAILEGAVAAGANEINGPAFEVDDPQKAREEAKAIAIQKAKDKAEKMADELGVRLVRIVDFSESGGMPPVFYERAQYDAYGKGGVAANASAPEIQPGENEVRITVSIGYKVK